MRCAVGDMNSVLILRSLLYGTAKSRLPLLSILSVLFASALSAQATLPFEYSSDGAEVTITGYSGAGGAVAIPHTIEGLPVSRIGDSVFEGRGDISSITIPESVRYVGSFAFAQTGLTNVTMPRRLDTGFAIFLGVGQLDLATGFLVLTVNGSTMITGHSEAVGELAIPRSIAGRDVTAIGPSAFDSAADLVSVILPQGIESIGSKAFSGSGLSQIELPDSLDYIGSGAFSGCGNLHSVTIPDGVRSIESNTFFHSGLRSIRLGGNVTRIGVSAFHACESLTSIVIPDQVTTIERTAFAACYGLTNVTIGSGVTSVPDWAFAHCVNLATVTLPQGIRSIGSSAFHESGLTRITLPQGLISIGEGTFSKCRSLTSVFIPGGVSFIPEGAFLDCSGLMEVSIGHGVTVIESGAFMHCRSLRILSIPTGITRIEQDAFRYCSSLRRVILPASLVSMGKGAFDTEIFECTDPAPHQECAYSGGQTMLYFLGNAPSAELPFGDRVAAPGRTNLPTIFHLPESNGWGSQFGGVPAKPWLEPLLTVRRAGLATSDGILELLMEWGGGRTVIIDACGDLVRPTWTPISTNIVTEKIATSFIPSDTDSPSRFYRLRTP